MDPRLQDQDPSSVLDRPVEAANKRQLQEEPVENPQEEEMETGPRRTKRRPSTPTKQTLVLTAPYPLSPITVHLWPSEDSRFYRMSETPAEGAETVTFYPLSESEYPSPKGLNIEPPSLNPVSGSSAANPFAETSAAESIPKESDDETLGSEESSPELALSPSESSPRTPLYPMSFTVHLRASEESCYYKVSRSVDDYDGAEIVSFIPRTVFGRTIAQPGDKPPAADPVADLSVVVPVAGGSFASEPHLGAGASGEQAQKRFRCPNCGRRFKTLALLALHIFIEMFLLERRWRGASTSSPELKQKMYDNYFRCDDMDALFRKLKRAYNIDTDSHQATLSAEDQQEARLPGCQAPQVQTESQKTKEQPELECNCCNPTKTFQSALSLLDHIFEYKDSRFDPPIHCPFCLPKDKVRESSKHALRLHLKEKHPDSAQFECPDCPENCHRRIQFDEHLKTFHKYRCPHILKGCKRLCYGQVEFEKHKEDHFDGIQVCPLCREQYKDRIDYQEHNVSFHTAHCFNCHAILFNATSLAKHLREEHDILEEDVPNYSRCPTCFRMIQDQHEYMEHLQQCRFRNPPCITCHKSLTTRLKLLNHIVSHHR